MRRSERLTCIVALLLTALTILVRPDGAALQLVAFPGVAIVTLLLSKAPQGRGGGFLRDWFPVAAVLTIFLLLQPIIEAAVPWRLDPALAAFDQRFLSWLVAAWRNAFGRPAAFTDAIYLAYFSYYLLPITVAAVARRHGPDVFERCVFALLLGFYVTYLGYILAPASGPRLPYAEEAQAMGGGAISDAVRAFLHTAETTTLDAFPSGHTAIAVISGVLASSLLGRLASGAVWLWAGAVVFATVYINVHYAVDVLEGLVIAVLVLAVCPRPSLTRSSVR